MQHFFPLISITWQNTLYVYLMLMHSKIYFILIITSTVLTSCTLFNRTPSASLDETLNNNDTIDLEVKKFTLKNGLRLLVYENHLLPIAAFYTFLDTGARHESIKQGTTGASHFLEHMLFKSTKKYPVPGTINHLLNKMGARSNAGTSYDYTVYYEAIPVKHLNQLIEINADRMKNLVIIPEQFESERKVIMEERKLRIENSPHGKLRSRVMAEIFTKNPYGGSVIGSIKDLTHLSSEQTLEFYKNFYTPDNMVIVVAGDVNADTIYKKISQAYGDMPTTSSHIKKYRKKVDHLRRYRHRAKYGRNIKVHGSSPVPIFTLAYKGKSIKDPERYVLDILSSTLFDGESSWFYQKYVKNKYPLVRTIHSYHYDLKFNGIFSISGELLPGVSLKKFKRRLIADTLKVCNKAINERSLQKTKNQFMTSYYSVIQTNGDIARFLGRLELFHGSYQHYKKEIAAYNAITVKQTKKACRKIFKKNNHLFISLWNKHSKKRNR